MSLHRYALLLCLLLPSVAMPAEAPRHVLPSTAIQGAMESAKDDPLRYAVGIATSLDASNGAWDEPVAGIARWRLGIDSGNALSLALRLEDLRLPTGAELRWIGEDSGDVQGPFGTDSSGVLLLPVVRGERAMLEVRLPTALREQFGLRVAEAQHGYLGLGDTSMAKGQFGTAAGACHVDVSCSAANDWLSQVRSVVLLTKNNIAFCSGTLVNNTRGDETPYILTANHCQFDRVSPDQIRAYFNVNRSGCGRGAEGSTLQNIRADSVVAHSTTGDFALLRLRDSDAGRTVTDFNVFFSGWDAGGAVPSFGVGIHHPRGDDKKISSYVGATKTAGPVAIGDFFVDAWEVFWRSGSTENVSSGSALFDQNGRIIGTLSGGPAGCDDKRPDSSNNLPDYFGRLELSWTGAGRTASNSLKPTLDPTNSGTTSLDGLNRGTNPPPSTSNPPTGGGGGGGGGAPSAALLAMLAGLGVLRRVPKLKR